MDGTSLNYINQGNNISLREGQRSGDKQLETQ